MSTPLPQLDDDALIGIAGDIVHAIAPNTEAHPVALLVDFLACFGSAVGPAPHVRVGGARHPARLFVVMTGTTSSGRKGQSRAEIRPLMASADLGWSDSRVVGGLSSGEGLIAAVQDDGDKRDGAVIDKRLLVVEEEFSHVLKVASRDGSTLSETVRRSWDSGDLRVLDAPRAADSHGRAHLDHRALHGRRTTGSTRSA